MREKHLHEDLADLAYKAESDHEVQMARAELYKVAKYAIKLHDMLKNVSEQEGLEGWVQSKITKAADYIGSVYHHMDYETKFDAVQEAKKAKPDYLDMDKDGNKKEPMKKAIKDKEKKNEAKEEMCPEACCGKPVTECKCGPDCKHCDCYAKNKAMKETDYKSKLASVLESKLSKKKEVTEKAKSKAQQKFMGMVHAMQKGEKVKGASPELKAVAKDMKKSDTKDFAKTKHKGLPDHVKEDQGFSDKQIKMAYGVANDKRYKGGNMTGAVAAIEKIAKGLSKHPDVQKVLQRTNEEKQKGVDGKACWKGYKRMGTKTKGGKTVDNCVKM